MIVLLATLLLAQAQPEHQRKPVPVPDTSRPAAGSAIACRSIELLSALTSRVE